MSLGLKVAAGLLLLLGSAGAALRQVTLFTTADYRQDRELWTDPSYYRHNTARELTDMQVNVRYGEAGSGSDDYDSITSPYAYRTSWEHYEAWREAAGGGTLHTLATLPDWDGYWGGGGSWLNSRGIQASTIAAALTPEYREYYVQQVKAESEGRHWWPASFCLPDGFIRGIQGAEQFILRPNQVTIINQRVHETQVRWVYTDGREHVPVEHEFPQWHGESIGFWDGDALVIHTNQIRRWNATHSMFEWSDHLAAVERYERLGNAIEGEITLYDPEAFIAPLHARLRFTLRNDADYRPIYNTCTDTNGISSNVYINEAGFLDERVPDDPYYWDPTDPRPWAGAYAIGDRAE